jgi:hypothetical protein
VFNEQAIDHKDYVFGDIRGMVGNSFQTSGDDHQVDFSGNGACIGHHIGEKFFHHLVI